MLSQIFSKKKNENFYHEVSKIFIFCHVTSKLAKDLENLSSIALFFGNMTFNFLEFVTFYKAYYSKFLNTKFFYN